MEDLKQEIASLKLQNALLRTEVAKWKRAHYYANKKVSRMEHNDLQRIEDAEKKEDKQ